MASLRTFARTVAVRALLAIAMTSAATSVSSPARADSAAPSAAAKAKAKRAFARGEKLYKDGKVEEAAAAFQESCDAVPDPTALLMLARIQRDNGELLKARATYQNARDAAEANGQASATLDEIKSELSDVDGVLGFIKIELSHAPPGTRVSIDDNDVTGQVGTPIRAEPGPLVVTATTPDGMEKSENAIVKAGQSSSVKLAFDWQGKPAEALPATPKDEVEPASLPPPKKEPAPEPKQPSSTKRTLAWVTGGVGVVGVATFAVFGSMSASKFKNLEGDCPQKHCDPGLENDKNTGKTFQTVANVGLIVGAVGLGTAVTLFVIGGPRDATNGNKPAQARLELGLGRVALSGSFQ
jgi:hypothetical protein